MWITHPSRRSPSLSKARAGIQAVAEAGTVG